MNKAIKYIIIAAVAVAIVWALSLMSTDTNNDSDVEPGSLGPVTQTSARGVVVEIDLEQAMVDGPYVVVMRGTDGSENVIAVPSMGIMLCAARESITSPYEFNVGDTIEVNGTLASDGSIVPCESPDHYLRLVQSN